MPFCLVSLEQLHMFELVVLTCLRQEMHLLGSPLLLSKCQTCTCCRVKGRFYIVMVGVHLIFSFSSSLGMQYNSMQIYFFIFFFIRKAWKCLKVTEKAL